MSEDEPEELPLRCPYCREPCARLIVVEYDMMVDGPGQTMSEERCPACVKEADR